MAEQFEKWLDDYIEARLHLENVEKRDIGGVRCSVCSDVFHQIHIYEGFDEIAKALNKLVTSEYKENVKRYRKSFKYKGWTVICYTEVIEDVINQD